MTQVRAQRRATKAWEQVGLVKDGPHGTQYASIAYRMPSLIHSAGLCQALHFADTRGSSGGAVWLEHLAEHLEMGSPGALLTRVRTAGLADYMSLTLEALAVSDWLVRMVQGILKIERGEADDGEPT